MSIYLDSLLSLAGWISSTLRTLPAANRCFPYTTSAYDSTAFVLKFL